ncbi:MAG: hypothetical protein NC822_04615 [Candidatus Omnitrophica bacterium]|nr:hypothetical protein [Candidatus Omnitrophota bacterium]MCM8826612.1 hypothetical protein [Candidatus Omnitrophota bacterium]
MKKSLSLIELIVSTAIISFIFAVIISVFYISNLNWNIEKELIKLQQTSRITLEGMIRELRQGRVSSLTISDDGKTIDFSIPSIGNSIRYTLIDNQIIRQDSNNRVILNNVNSLNFCCDHGNLCDTNCSDTYMLCIHLVTSKQLYGRQLSFSLKEKVRLRNE